MPEQTHTIIKHRSRGRKSEATGTLKELTNHFSYTLEAGNSYDSKVSRAPRTARTLVNNLNRAVDSLQRGSWDPDYYELVIKD